MTILRSRDNPRVRRWMRLFSDRRERRREGRAMLEGPHLVAAALASGLPLRAVVASEAGMASAEVVELVRSAGQAPVIVTDAVFRAIADADTPQGIAAEIDVPVRSKVAHGTHVFLEGVQDAGNVGAIIRSAAAFGAVEVVLDSACADPWSPKTLRAGMGGHFVLTVRAVGRLGAEVERFPGRVVAAAATGGRSIAETDLSGPLAWVFGSEGRGLSESLQSEADALVSIPTAPGTESLNVAAAAAICLYETFNRPGERS